jgi:UDP-N-acetylglucosamine 1-carboxyvinyltransferase
MIITIPKAKNSLLPILTIPIIFKGKYKFNNVYLFTDIKEQIRILELLNIKVEYKNNDLIINSLNLYIPDNLKITQNNGTRGITYFYGSLIKHKKQITFDNPGGCNIGKRSIDIHLDFFKKLLVNITENDKNIIIDSTNYNTNGNITYNLSKISVGATINCILASIYCKNNIQYDKEQKVILTNVALDPYIIDFINVLKKINIDINIDIHNRLIELYRTSISSIKDNNFLEYDIIEDPIIIGTYIILDIIFKKNYTFKINNINNLGEYLNILTNLGVIITKLNDNLYKFSYLNNNNVMNTSNNINHKKILEIYTNPFPGFYTDLQPLLLILCKNLNIPIKIIDNVMDNRFKYAYELQKIGYNLNINKKSCEYTDFKLNKNIDNITLTDLRGGFAIYCELIYNKFNLKNIAINNYDYILRGYDMEYINTMFFFHNS